MQNVANKMYFKLFQSCIPVNGATRSVICDLQRSELYYISEGLYEVLTTHRNKTIEEIKREYNNEVDGEIDNYFSYLVDNEIGFYTLEPENFPDIDTSFERPEFISNTIIESNNNSDHDWLNIINQLQSLGCKFAELRFYDSISVKELYRIIDLFEKTCFRGIYLVLKYHSDFANLDFNTFLLQYQRVCYVVIHGSPKLEKNHNQRVRFYTEIIEDNRLCGSIAIQGFAINMPMFFESMQYNNCLNKKVTISPNGELKNCPSFRHSHGNINYDTIQEVISKDSFQEKWSIGKDSINICKSCEYRYICSDCRAFLADPNDLYSKPLKCGYDPHTGKWEEWTTNPLNQKAIAYYKKESVL